MAKAIEDAKLLDAQHRRTLRRKGSGMLEKSIWEPERPRLVFKEHFEVRVLISSDAKQDSKPSRGVGGARSTVDGQEKIT